MSRDRRQSHKLYKSLESGELSFSQLAREILDEKFETDDQRPPHSVEYYDDTNLGECSACLTDDSPGRGSKGLHSCEATSVSAEFVQQQKQQSVDGDDDNDRGSSLDLAFSFEHHGIQNQSFKNKNVVSNDFSSCLPEEQQETHRAQVQEFGCESKQRQTALDLTADCQRHSTSYFQTKHCQDDDDVSDYCHGNTEHDNLVYGTLREEEAEILTEIQKDRSPTSLGNANMFRVV